MPHTADIDVNEIRDRIDSNSAVAERQGRALQGYQAAARDADVRGLCLDVHAVFGDAR